MSGGGGGGGGRRRGGRGGGGGRASPAKSKSDRSAGLVGRPSRSRRFSEDDPASSELSTVGKRRALARGEGVVGVIDTSNETEPPECGSRSSCDTPRAYEDTGATLDDVREAVTTLEDIERTSRRVLGDAHPLTAELGESLQQARAILQIRGMLDPRARA